MKLKKTPIKGSFLLVLFHWFRAVLLCIYVYRSVGCPRIRLGIGNNRSYYLRNLSRSLLCGSSLPFDCVENSSFNTPYCGQHYQKVWGHNSLVATDLFIWKSTQLWIYV